MYLPYHILFSLKLSLKPQRHKKHKEINLQSYEYHLLKLEH